MKTIFCTLFIAAVIQIAACAPASHDEPSTTITPLGPMDLDQLAELFLIEKFHTYDHALPEVKAHFKAWVAKFEEIIAHPETRRSQVKYYVEIKNYFTTFLTAVENQTNIDECGLKQIGIHYHHLFREFANHHENENIKHLFETFHDEYNEAFREKHETGNAALKSLRENESLRDKVIRHAKFGTVCCQFWDKSYHHSMINGTC